MARKLTQEELLTLPISSIVDGWRLRDGGLHLMVRCPDGVVRAHTIPSQWVPR